MAGSSLKETFDDIKSLMQMSAEELTALQKKGVDEWISYQSRKLQQEADTYADEYAKAMMGSNDRINKYQEQERNKAIKKRAKATAKEDQEYKKKTANLDKNSPEFKLLENQHLQKLKYIEEESAAELEAANEVAKQKAAIESRDENASNISSALSSGNIKKLKEAIKQAQEDDEDGDNAKQTGLAAIADFADTLKSTINEVASYKSAIDTRLQGSTRSRVAGSYWGSISKNITGVAAVSPYVTQSSIASKVQSMVNQGISYNVEQRAFLATISDKIATTFNETNGSLARLVRIQQQDSTAARLGMESALTSFLNNMYETTEYMSDVMSSIRGSLEEAEALMTKEASTEFDYQVNKWLGSLYSVGMSQSAVQSIGTALGDLAAGKISGITSDGAGNLIVMAANNAGLSVSDLLQDGLDASNTNKLMTAMVEYLKGIYDDTNGSLVLQQQYADVFGMTASDLKSLANLSTTDIKNTASNGLSYSGMLGQLTLMAGTMWNRTSTGEMLTNLTDNLKYTMAAGIGSNPALYAAYTLGDILDSTVGGMDFSLPTYMGTGMSAQTFNVADILKTGALGGSIIQGVASMLGSMSSGGISGIDMLRTMGVYSSNSVSRGSGSGLISTGGATYSSSGYVGNASSGDVYEKSMTDTKDSANSQVAEAAEENNEATTTDINNNILLMYQLLQDVTSGTLSFKVDMGDQSSWSQVMHATY